MLDGKASGFSQNPDTYRVPGFALGDEAEPPPRGLVARRERGQSSGQCRPATVRQPHAVDLARQQHLGRGGLHPDDRLPYGFTLRAGRFFSGIGYLNEQHSHTWDFVDEPLPYRVFLNTQYDDDGVQLRWLAPTDQFLEFGVEAVRGDAFPAGGAATTMRRRRVERSSSIPAATSATAAASAPACRCCGPRPSNRDHDAAPDGTDDIFSGTRPTSGSPTASRSGRPNGNAATPTSSCRASSSCSHEQRGSSTAFALLLELRRPGFYVQGVYQFMPRWRVGAALRAARSGNRRTRRFAGTTLDNLGDDAAARHRDARLQPQRVRPLPPAIRARPLAPGTTDNQVILQYHISLGAHGAHSY